MDGEEWFVTIWSELVAQGERIAELLPVAEDEIERRGGRAASRESVAELKATISSYNKAADEANLLLQVAQSGEHGIVAKRAVSGVQPLAPLRLDILTAEYDFDLQEGFVALSLPRFPRLDHIPSGDDRTVALLLQRELLPDDAIEFFDSLADTYIP